MKITNMSELKNKAFPFEYGMKVHYPQFGKDEWIYPSQGTCIYCSNNGIWAILDESGKEYIIPYFEGIFDLLKENGYTEKCFHIPFSNWDKPADFYLNQKWINVKSMVA